MDYTQTQQNILCLDIDHTHKKKENSATKEKKNQSDLSERMHNQTERYTERQSWHWSLQHKSI
jgi:hypothetical protein